MGRPREKRGNGGIKSHEKGTGKKNAGEGGRVPRIFERQV